MEELLKCQTESCTNRVRGLALCNACEFIQRNETKKLAEVERKATTAAKKLEIRKEAHARAKAAAEARAQAREEVAAETFDYSEACDADLVRDILRDRRNLSQGYIVEAAYRLGVIASKRLKIVANRFFWTNGVLSTLASIRDQEARYLLPEVEDTKAQGEVFRNQDVLVLWDMGCSWREQPAKEILNWEEGHLITWDEYRTLRALKTQPCCLGNTLLDKDFESLHEEWEEFYPRIAVDVLPENYTQKQFKKALRELAEIRRYCQLAFRGSFKTSWMVCYLLCFIACFYDVRILFASAGSALSTDTLDKLKDHFIVENENLTLYQQVFAELVLYTKDDQGSKLTYECPAARLHLAQSTCFAVGLESKVAGRRCDILLADDLSDNTNSDNPELREGTQRRWELMTELLEGAGAGLIFQIGTPYAVGDLLFSTLDAADRNTEKTVAVRLDPCFTFKDEARRREVMADLKKLLPTVVEDEVIMTFPAQYNWKAFRTSLTNSKLIRNVLQQKLLIFTEDGDDTIRLNFDLQTLHNNIVNVPPTPAQELETRLVMSVDRAHSTNQYADKSAIAVTQYYVNKLQQLSACVLTTRASRWLTAELAKNILDVWEEFHPQIIILEQDPAWRDLDLAIKTEREKRHINHLPLFWRPVDQTSKSKIIRFKGLEAMLNKDPEKSRLTFLRGPQIEETFENFTWQDGTRRSGPKNKDDIADAIGQSMLLLPTKDPSEDAQAAKAKQDEDEVKAEKQRQYDRIYGPNTMFGTISNPTVQPVEEENPIDRYIHPSIQKRPPKFMSFADAPRVAPK